MDIDYQKMEVSLDQHECYLFDTESPVELDETTLKGVIQPAVIRGQQEISDLRQMCDDRGAMEFAELREKQREHEARVRLAGIFEREYNALANFQKQLDEGPSAFK